MSSMENAVGAHPRFVGRCGPARRGGGRGGADGHCGDWHHGVRADPLGVERGSAAAAGDVRRVPARMFACAADGQCYAVQPLHIHS